MNRKVILSWLILIAMVVVSACQQPTAQPTVTEAPASEEPSVTEAPATEQPAVTEAPVTEAPVAEEFPTPFIPVEDKPPLSFSQPVPDDQGVLPGVAPQLIAYTFPADASDWTIPMKVGPFMNLQVKPYNLPGGYENLTPVGLVEIGVNPGVPEQQPEPGLHMVAIEVGSTGNEIPGRYFKITENNEPDANVSDDVFFLGILQELNPARAEPPFDQFPALNPNSNTLPDVSAAISADGLCFVVKTDDQPTYIRYCTQPNSVFSVQANFASQYENLIASMGDAMEALKGQGYLEPDANIQIEQIISEMEDPQRLQGCANANKAEQDSQALQEACNSDISVAPVTTEYFDGELDEARGQSAAPGSGFVLASLSSPAFQNGVPFQVPVAVVRVLHPIQASGNTIRPGEYRMDYWYQVVDANDVFHHATITGVTTDGEEVTDQQIPAVPATFINADDNDPEQPGAQISVCRIFGVCTFFQKSCT